MLESLGLDPMEERVYRFLVATAEADITDLIGNLGIDAQTVETILISMRVRGLIRTIGPGRRRFAAVAPDIVLGSQLLRHQQAIDWARREVDQLSEEYRDSVRRRDAGRLVEVLPNRAALQERLDHLQETARHEVLHFCRDHETVLPSEENHAEFAALRRGVEYRVIYEKPLLAEEGMPADIAYGVKLGEQARVMSWLPVRLTIVDHETAVLPLVQVDGISEQTAALIRGGQLLEALIALFECYWERATLLRIAEDGALTERTTRCPLGPDDLYLVSLLVGGASDTSIATQLGVSQRTVQRRVSNILDVTGARTRTQLAWRAATEHWL
ncbi:helix-turn-helix domain-containing protein [Streptosporangium sp. NPDC006930]|uniref:helix-turn-helix domain-containing protein n=1 Tax=Streptosporangium sp. NPDC006930 TaxID=3154783 RepID=UPI0034248A16